MYTPAPFPIYDLHINASQPVFPFQGWGGGAVGIGVEMKNSFSFWKKLILGITLVVKKLFISVKALPFGCWSDT